MSLRLYPLAVNEHELRTACAGPAPGKSSGAKEGARLLWRLTDEMIVKVGAAAKELSSDPGGTGPSRVSEETVMAIVGLALNGASGELLQGDAGDWKSAVLEDFATWADGRLPNDAGVALSMLANGRDLLGRRRQVAGDCYYTLLTASETMALSSALLTLNEDGFSECPPELHHFQLDLLDWTEACSNCEMSLLIAVC